MEKSRLLLLLLLPPLAALASSADLNARDSPVQCTSNPSFSCPSGSSCLPTTSTNTTVICCPNDQNCALIQPLTCDISQQNATLYPGNLVHTTDLSATLLKCGDECCPSGYNCQGGMCVLTTATPTSSSQSPQTASSTSVAAGTSAAAPTASSPPASSTGQSSSKTPLAIGLAVGVVSSLLLILGLLYCLKRRRKAKQSYVSQVYRSKTGNESDEDFMGSTPRPPLHDKSSHARRQVTPPTRVIGDPVWDSGLNGSASLHRTDFLLRRGSVETGYEGRVKPSWSTRTRSRPKSKSLFGGLKPSIASPKTPDARRASRLPPLFATPLRFGLPTTPKPATATASPHDRPPRGEENLARLVNLGGKTVPSGAAVRVDNATPPPSRAKKCEIKPSGRTAGADVLEPSGGGRRTDVCGRPPPRSRAVSELTTATIESSSSSIETDEDGNDDKSDTKGQSARTSRETINVMLPPPSVFRTPPPTARDNGIRDDEVLGAGGAKRDTTFDELIRQADWRTSAWKGR